MRTPDSVVGCCFALSVGIASGCMEKEPLESNVIARVADRTLSWSEVSAWETAQGRRVAPEEERADFIQSWVEEQILYQAALENGLRDDPWVTDRLEEISRTLFISRLLQKEEAKIPPPAPSLVKSYYQEHSDEFVWEHLHLKIEYWRSQDKNGMDMLRADLLRGKKSTVWFEVGDLRNERVDLNGEASADPQVWKVASKLTPGQVSNVVSINDSFWIFKLLDRRKAGEQQDIEDVREEIIARLSEDARSRKRDEIIRSLQEEYLKSGVLDWSNPIVTVSINDPNADSLSP